MEGTLTGLCRVRRSSSQGWAWWWGQGGREPWAKAAWGAGEDGESWRESLWVAVMGNEAGPPCEGLECPILSSEDQRKISKQESNIVRWISQKESFWQQRLKQRKSRQGGQQGSILDGPIQGRKAQVALVCNLRVPRSQTGIETVKAQVLQLLLLKWAWRWVMRQSRIWIPDTALMVVGPGTRIQMEALVSYVWIFNNYKSN